MKQIKEILQIYLSYCQLQAGFVQHIGMHSNQPAAQDICRCTHGHAVPYLKLPINMG